MNSFAGGTHGAANRFELDYFAVAANEAGAAWKPACL